MCISKVELMKIVENSEALGILCEVGVDPVALMDLQEYLFTDASGKDTSLSFPDFMDIVLDLRGSNSATVKDIMNLTKTLRREFKDLHDAVEPVSRQSHHLTP